VRKLYKRAAARRDLVEHFVYLAAEGGEELAERFLSQAEASCEVLLDQPEIGSPLVANDPGLSGIRKWPVKDFQNFLIFYVPHDRGVTIVRVLYARQDWWELLGII
jgi:toxin ParE1/3/4